MRFATTLVSAAAFSQLCKAGFVLEDDYMTDFYGNFDFFTGPDPTEGFVKYVDEATARQTNLINGSSSGAAQFGVDVTNQTPEGRPSIRIGSKKTYDHGLIVLDVAHMPQGCGTWPAFWTIGPNWPVGGEIDILEGVNEQSNNAMTLHTGPGCQIGSDTTQFSGELSTGNCDIAAEGQGKNVGCSIKHPSEQSYGAGLNAIGGGVYATLWNSDAISVYFFPRDSIPADALGDSPDPSGWGKPSAKFEGACDIDKMFVQQQIIIDTTFCGQWAAQVWGDGSCASKAATCNDWVRDNPEAFTEAYWEINALRVYQDDGNAPADPAPPATPSPSAAPSSGIPVPAPAPSATETPIPGPAPTISNSPPIIDTSSQVAVPEPSPEPVPEEPSEPTTTPVAPLPSDPIPAPDEPPAAPRPSRRPWGGRPPRPAPTGRGGMVNPWNWPRAGKDAAAPPQPSVAPAQEAANVEATPTEEEQKGAQLPNTPADSGDAPPAVPYVPAGANGAPVHIVYETVYVTVKAAETPAPDAKMARHAREHRRRWTQHNARA